MIGYYCSSKWAFEAIHESLATEVKDFGIKVAIIELGAYATEFGSQDSLKFAAGMDSYADFKAQFFEGMKTWEEWQAVAASAQGEPKSAIANV